MRAAGVYKFTALFLAACTLISVFSIRAVGAQSSVDQKKRELSTVEKQIKLRRDNIFLFKRQERSVLVQLNKTEMELEETRDRLSGLKRQVSQTEAAIYRAAAELRIAMTELVKAETRLKQRVDTLSRRLRAMYIRGAGDYFELLLTSVEFSDFITRYDMLERIVKQDIELFNEVKAEKEAVENQRTAIARKKSSLEQKRDVLKQLAVNVTTEENRITRQKRAREAVLEEVRNKRELEEKLLDELERVSEELSKMIERMLANSKSKVVTPDTGKMMWPVNGRVTSPYGWRFHPIFKIKKFHSGIDIGARSGTPIAAARSGIILFAGWYTGYGKTVIIDHGGKVSTAYAHCSVILVKAGQKVSRGQTIARVGSTGYSTGPHLHFEVRVGGNKQNPRAWLP